MPIRQFSASFRLGSREHRRLQSALVVAQVALTGVLLVGAGLLIMRFWYLRTQEIGTGWHWAPGTEIVRLVAGQSLVLTVVGLAVGLIAAAMVTRYLRTLLFGLTPLDPMTLVAVVLAFAAVAVLAAYAPARRATTVDPLVALR